MEDTETAEDFLKIAPQFKLGCLLTEQQSPQTIGLSQLAKNDVPAAIDKIKNLDIHTIQVLQSKIPQLERLYTDVNQCLQDNGRIYMCGCGATGRLAMVLETLWRQQTKQIYPDWINRTVAFMAGGDAALIKSVEDFQDHPEFAEKQLIELGFTQNDLLIGSTEGGETPWVIGAIWKAVEVSKRKPYILYGNTDQILIANVERSRKFIESDKIEKINCNVGHMALAGSTRMQSTTILMHAIGISLLGCDRLRNIRHPQKSWMEYAKENVRTILEYVQKNDFSVLEKLIVEESNIYKKGEQITYIAEPYFAISILTDTTERSPTFSLLPFPNKYTDSPNYKCWCNMKIVNPKSEQLNEEEEWDRKVEEDWRCLLADRQIRGLDSEYWAKYKQKVSKHIIQGFSMHTVKEHTMTILLEPSLTFIPPSKEQVKFPKYPSSCRLSHHSVLKILLNNLSTVIMGRMERYESNIMTYVKPTNYKLIDRATRYVMMLRPNSEYGEVVRMIYQIKNEIKPDDPIVLKVIEELNKQA